MVKIAQSYLQPFLTSPRSPVWQTDGRSDRRTDDSI